MSGRFRLSATPGRLEDAQLRLQLRDVPPKRVECLGDLRFVETTCATARQLFDTR
jgi:hypothetical protein